MESLIKRLKEIYPRVKFQESNENENKILLYDNRDLMWDDEFNNVVLELAEECLDKETYNSFAYVYDFLDEMSASLEVQKQSEFKVVKTFEIKDYRFTVEKKCEVHESEGDATAYFGKTMVFLY